ncbi:MAG TPA: TCR/Tet family MFS transporter [Candidatus Dormibacteraeota bacterium]|jgi:DHA1 family tetracycline resistance protein-like MFS transporter|nr:TCR/Tet family MFS transporter [Candidatus Dormibacteraeota bacterium]
MTRAAFAFIFITVLLDMIAFGVVIPVFPGLVVRLEGGDTAAGATAFGVFGAAWALMQFLFQPVLGGLSDRFGRRPVILLSNLGLGLDYIVMALAPNLAWLFLGRVVSGITSSSFSAANAYIADVTPPEKRAARFGMVGVAFGIGFIIGPALGGALGAVDLRAPFWAAAALSLANFAYGFFILPESLPAERRSAFQIHAANPIGALHFVRTRPGLSTLAIAAFFAYLAHDSLPAVFVLFTQYRFAWDERAVGLALALVGVSSMVVQGLVVGRAVERLGERGALAAALMLGLIAQLLLGLAPVPAVFIVGIALWSFFGLFGPSLLGLATRSCAPTEQGRLQGVFASLHAVTAIAAPLMFTQTFALAVGDLRAFLLPGSPFVLSALLLAASLATVWRVVFGARAESPAAA